MNSFYPEEYTAGSHLGATNGGYQFKVTDLMEELSQLTDEQRSLVWCPEPRRESLGAGDSRMGGSSGIDWNGETRRSRWVVARYRMLKEQRRGA